VDEICDNGLPEIAASLKVEIEKDKSELYRNETCCTITGIQTQCMLIQSISQFYFAILEVFRIESGNDDSTFAKSGFVKGLSNARMHEKNYLAIITRHRI